MLKSSGQPLPEFLTPAQAARRLRIHRPTLERWEREGFIRSVPGQLYYRREDIQKLLDANMYSSRLSRLSGCQLLEQLAGLMRQISTRLDTRQLAQTVVEEASRLMQSRRCSVWRLDESGQYWQPLAAIDHTDPGAVGRLVSGQLVRLDQQPLFEELLATGQVTYLTDALADSRLNPDFSRRFGSRAWLMAPLKEQDGRVTGLLNFSWGDQPRLFTDEELVFAEALAAQTATGLENARRYEVQISQASQLQTLFETLNDGVIVYDRQAQVVRYNRAVNRLFPGFDQLGNLPLAERTATYNVRLLDGAPIQPTTNPPYRAAVLGESFFRQVYLVNGESGPDTLMEYNGQPLFNEQGERSGGVIVFRNVTEQYQAQQRLEELTSRASQEAARLSAIIESAQEGIVVYDNESRIVLVNPKITEFYGFRREEMVGLTAAEFGRQVAPLFDPTVDLSSMIHRVEQPDQANYLEEYRIIAPRSRTLQRLVAPVQDQQGRVLGKVAIYRDVTEERELNRAKDEFLSLATHELKTPLTAIKGFSQLLLIRLQKVQMAEAEQLRLQEAAQKINQQASRVNDLMNNLLDMSRLATGRFEIQPRPVNLPEIAGRLVDELQVLSSRHQLRLLNELGPASLVQADPLRLEQVIRNLLENSIKYSPVGGTVTLRLLEPAFQPGWAQVSVSDQGIGIAPEQQNRLFEKFYRASNATTVSVGLGLGLSICAEIIRLHGGRIWVESQGENQGSTFSFTLPLANH